MTFKPDNKLLVTGGAGFIGVNFIKYILEKEDDIQIINLDLLTYAGNLESLDDIKDDPRHFFVKGDIRDREFVSELIEKHRISGIINFAAESHVDRSIEGPEIFINTNVKGTLNLLELAKKYNIERFLQVSTDEVYGSLGKDGLFTENTPLSPNSPYSASKASADHLVHSYQHTFGLNTLITRCSNNYGPYQFPEKMLPLCINNIKEKKNIPVYGDGLQIRDWLYVEDHCSAIWKVYKNGASGEVFNIGGCNEKTNLELLNTLLDIMNADKSLIKFVKDRPGHDRRYAIDASKIINELNWKPSVTFEQGLNRTVKWYLDNKKWLENLTSGEYLKYYSRMYDSR